MDSIYIHLDNTSNCILSKGLTYQDFLAAVPEIPEHILLLDPSDKWGEYESRTGLNMVRGIQNVEQYFAINSKNGKPIKWIDFSDIQLVKELTPLEISELLYFGHMKMHLHSPFFYKLQNNYVYFEGTDQILKIYFRHLSIFYEMLSHCLTQLMSTYVNRKKYFFQKKEVMAPIAPDLLVQLKRAMQEGLVFKLGTSDHKQRALLDMYVVEDKLQRIQSLRLNSSENQKIGYLSYDTVHKQWDITLLSTELESTQPFRMFGDQL